MGRDLGYSLEITDEVPLRFWDSLRPAYDPKTGQLICYSGSHPVFRIKPVRGTWACEIKPPRSLTDPTTVLFEGTIMSFIDPKTGERLKHPPRDLTKT